MAYSKHDKYDVKVICAADLHLRDTAPSCRKEGEFFRAQANKLRRLNDELVRSSPRKVHKILLVAGDFFHRWKVDMWLLSQLITEITGSGWFVTPGQHDLPGHNPGLINNSALSVLASARSVSVNGTKIIERYPEFVLARFPWGCTRADYEEKARELEYDLKQGVVGRRPIFVMLHHFVYDASEKEPFPGAKQIGISIQEIADIFACADLVVTGDNHQVLRYRHVVNPGSMLRLTVAQREHRPGFFTWRKGIIKRVEFDECFPEDILEPEKPAEPMEVREDDIRAFIHKLKSGGTAPAEGMSSLFDRVLRTVMEQRKVKSGTKTLLNELLYGMEE